MFVMIEFLKAETLNDLNRCLAIRRTVFIEEKNVPESIEVDEMDCLEGPCKHFIVCCNGVDVGAFRLRVNGDCVRLQRFCFLAKERGKGYGSETMRFIEKWSNETGIKKIEFDAKLESSRFYVKNGYVVVSDEFEEAGIPHVKMEKVL